jgi:rod shape-determining protein MreB
MGSQSFLSSVVGHGLAVDLGTANTVIYAHGHGIVLDEPSVVAVGRADGRVVAVGADAKAMIGRTPRHIETVKPLQDGVVADFDLCEQMLRYFVQKVQHRRWTRPRMVICVPSGVTGVEQRSVQEAAESAGARKPVGIIEEPLAAAIGSGLPIHEPHGNMIVDIGGGTTEVAVISLGGVVADASIRIGGDEFDDAIRDFTKREHSIAIGERTAEEIKQKLASAWPLEEEFVAEIRGSDLGSGLPKTACISTVEVREAIEVPLSAVVDAVKSALDRTPPELAADLMERGITITGGGALLHGIDRILQAETAMPIRLAPNPLYSVVLGSARALGS